MCVCVLGDMRYVCDVHPLSLYIQSQFIAAVKRKLSIGANGINLSLRTHTYRHTGIETTCLVCIVNVFMYVSRCGSGSSMHTCFILASICMCAPLGSVCVCVCGCVSVAGGLKPGRKERFLYCAFQTAESC